MRIKSFVVLLTVAAFTLGLLMTGMTASPATFRGSNPSPTPTPAASPGAQEPDDDVRGAFLSSRPKTTNANAPTRRHRPRHTNSNSNNTSSSAAKNTNANTATNPNTARNQNNSKNESQAIGLGYTLFMEDASGREVRVEPSREFHNGDSVRLALEPNVDGYLYVFDAENEGAPQMIYPDPRLDAGDNSVEAHVPIEIPSSEETNELLRWYTFYGHGGSEHLYVVITREPLNGVPTGDELVGLCATQKNKCPWHPSADVWAQVSDATKAEVKAITAKTFGQTQSDKEKVATTRGLGLDQSAPLPSVIRMNVSTKAPLLVTVLDLMHK